MSTAQERLEEAVQASNKANRRLMTCSIMDLPDATKHLQKTTDDVITAYDIAKAEEMKKEETSKEIVKR